MNNSEVINRLSTPLAIDSQIYSERTRNVHVKSAGRREEGPLNPR